MIRHDSGCMLAVMALTGCNQNASGSDPACLLGKLMESCAIKADITIVRSKGGGDSSVVRAPDSSLKGRGFESLLERRENFLLQGSTFCADSYFGIRSTPVLPQ